MGASSRGDPPRVRRRSVPLLPDGLTHRAAEGAQLAGNTAAHRPGGPGTPDAPPSGTNGPHERAPASGVTHMKLIATLVAASFLFASSAFAAEEKAAAPAAPAAAPAAAEAKAAPAKAEKKAKKAKKAAEKKAEAK